MILKVLGTESPYCTKQHNCPGFLISDGDTKLMLDAGSGTHRLLNLPEDLKNLTVVLTHLHRDHYNDVFNLQYASYVFNNQKRLEKRIEIRMPANPEDIAKDIINEPNSYANYGYVGEDVVLKVGNMIVTFLMTDHPVETYAVKVENKEGTIVYTSDTSFSAKDRIVEFAKGADILICEASLLVAYGFDEYNSHLTAKQAGIIAKEAQVKKLILTHFWPEETKNNYYIEAVNEFEDVEIAIEGKEYKI